MAFKKGQGGRPKGAKNKAPLLREMLAERGITSAALLMDVYQRAVTAKDLNIAAKMAEIAIKYTFAMPDNALDSDKSLQRGDQVKIYLPHNGR